MFNDYLDKNSEKTSLNFKALADLSLKVLTCTDNDPEKTQAITEETYTKLTGDDIKALAVALTKACNLRPLPEGDTLEALGAILFDHLTEQIRNMVESDAKIKQMLDKNFGSLSESLKVNLGENLSALSAIRESLKMSPAVEAMRKIQEEQKQFYGGLSAIQKSLKMSPHLEAMQKVQEKQKRLYGQNESGFAPATTPFSKSGIDVSSLILPPKFEETPVGRAASRVAIAGEESARQLGEVAGLVGQMVEEMAKLQTSVQMEVLPQWYKNIEDSSDATNKILNQTEKTLNQTEKSLYWARWALIASVIVTVTMTGWQLWIGHQYKLENDAQQNTSESLMRQQLSAAQELNKLIAHSMRRTEELAKMNQFRVSSQTPKVSGSVTQKVEKSSQ